MTTAVLLLAALAVVAAALLSLLLEPSRTGAVCALGGGVVALAAGGAGDLALLVAVCGFAQVAILAVEGKAAGRPPVPVTGAIAVGAILGVALMVAGRGVGDAVVGVELVAAPLTALAVPSRRARGWIGLGALAVEALGVGVLAAVAPSLAWGELCDGPHDLGVLAALVIVGVGVLGRLACAARSLPAGSR